VAEALREFMAFHGCERLAIERSEPAALSELLLERAERAGEEKIVSTSAELPAGRR
jgi:hypothetical protein